MAGWTVAVTADRRAGEQVTMLERRGASVMHAPVIRMRALESDARLRAATVDLVERPPDVLVVSTGIGVRTWFASAWTWGLGHALTDALAGTRILARGPKAAAAVVGEGLDVAWRAPSETLDGVLEHLLAQPLRGLRVAVQLPGAAVPRFVGPLRAAGPTVVELAAYEWALPEPSERTRRLVDAILAGEVDAVTFTSAYSVQNLLALAGEDSERVRECLRTGSVAAACVGPITAEAANQAGAVDVVVARPARLGAMVRALSDRLAQRAQRMDLAGVDVTVQGARVQVGATEARLTARERRLLELLLRAGGASRSKGQLSQQVWGADVDDHTVEVAVNRLRRKLGTAAAALETTNRRGYRLVADAWEGPGRPERRLQTGT
jgi:uroporphyrinogen-III synthase